MKNKITLFFALALMSSISYGIEDEDREEQEGVTEQQEEDSLPEDAKHKEIENSHIE